MQGAPGQIQPRWELSPPPQHAGAPGAAGLWPLWCCDGLGAPGAAQALTSSSPAAAVLPVVPSEPAASPPLLFIQEGAVPAGDKPALQPKKSLPGAGVVACRVQGSRAWASAEERRLGRGGEQTRRSLRDAPRWPRSLFTLPVTQIPARRCGLAGASRQPLGVGWQPRDWAYTRRDLAGCIQTPRPPLATTVGLCLILPQASETHAAHSTVFSWCVPHAEVPGAAPPCMLPPALLGDLGSKAKAQPGANISLATASTPAWPPQPPCLA